MRHGFLKVFILHRISKEPATGYELMKISEALIGYRPSAGSVYPLLRSMVEEGLIRGDEEEGGRVRYSITEKGRKKIEELRELKKEYLKKISRSLSIAMEVFEEGLEHKHDALHILAPAVHEAAHLLEKGVSEEKLRPVVERFIKDLRELEGSE